MRPLTLKKVFTLRSTRRFLADLHAAAAAAGLTTSDFIRVTVGERIGRPIRRPREDDQASTKRAA